jgi:uncharacterized membrane protein
MSWYHHNTVNSPVKINNNGKYEMKIKGREDGIPENHRMANLEQPLEE